MMPERIMNRMPVPVHDAVCTGGKMAVSLLAELALVWRPSWKSLCLGFHNKIVVVFRERIISPPNAISAPVRSSWIGW